MDHHHYYPVLLFHQIHQYQYNQQLKEIFEILKQMMLLVNVFEYLDHDIDK
jgi:hypothetical protein